MITRRNILHGLPAAALVGLNGVREAAGQSPLQPLLFEPAQYGAKGDGKAFDSPAINKAIDACNKAGGGMVYLRPGVYRCGTVVMKSRVTLYVEAGATILGSLDLADYTPFSGPPPKGDANDKHLIFAKDAEDITLAGPGRIDGQGKNFWVPSGREPLSEADQWAEVTAHAWFKSPLGRPSPMLEFVGCKGLRIEGLRIENAAGWTLRPINCDDVFLHGLRVTNPNIGPNTDGFDICGCQNVFISDCVIDTGDDCICLKSENHYGPEPRLTRNVTVTNCTMTTCCNGFKLGTATEGGFENIVFSNSVIYNNPGPYKDRVISGIALEVVDGGWIDGVTVTNIRMQRTRTPVFIRFGNRNNKHHYKQNGLRNVTISNIEASEALLASSVTGVPGRTVENVTLSGLRIGNVLEPRPEWTKIDVPEKVESYPEARMFGMLPATGLYVRHAQGIELRDLRFENPKTEPRPTLVLDDVRDVSIANLRTTAVAGAQPVIVARDTTDMWVRESRAPQAAAYLRAEGSTNNVLISGCDLRAAAKTLDPTGSSTSVTLRNNAESDHA